jgi:hypothetical protein
MLSVEPTPTTDFQLRAPPVLNYSNIQPEANGWASQITYIMEWFGLKPKEQIGVY